MIWCVIQLEAAIRTWIYCGHKGMNMVSNPGWLWCSNDTKGLKVLQYPHQQHESLIQVMTEQCFHVVYVEF